PGPRPSSNSFLPRRSLPWLNGCSLIRTKIRTSLTRGLLAQQMRVECMARRNVLVEAARVLYLESAPPAGFDAGRQASSVEPIDASAARQLPGVLGVYTGADLAEYGTLKCIVQFKNRDGTPMKQPPRPALATDKVRFVGDPVAFVVAETLLEAKDAAEAVDVEIDSLAAVVRPEEAARPGAPLLHEEAPGNVALDYHYGDSEQVAAAF